MKKMLDLVVTDNVQLNQNYCLLKFTTADGEILPDMKPGQFVEVRVDNSEKTFLRRPFSVNFVDKEQNEMWLLIQKIGEGTRKMGEYKKGDTVNMLLSLGKTFSFADNTPFDAELLLIGGGVGTAPMLFLGAILKEKGYNPKFLLGARSKNDLLQLNEFTKYGEVYCTTEDGSLGEKGYVTNHSILQSSSFNKIFTCGPKPMMVAVAHYAASKNIECEVSLENTMACGFGVCLCCVEKTHKGHVCVCTEGPVFNIKDLTWTN